MLYLSFSKLSRLAKHSLKLIPYALLLLLLACPEPEPENPQKANCPNGQLPCEEDSTICCDVICPPGTLLGGEDSTECIPVECPEYYYLCGEDSTDCCLETTSHDIIWEVDTIFTGFVNYAKDVAIINDTTIWVVGEFELDDPEDSISYFEGRFNLIRWNSTGWISDRILSSSGTQAPTLSSIFSINEQDIWVGSQIPRHWDGNNWSVYNSQSGWPLFDAFINAIWGSGSNDIFFVSVYGQINHWNGSGFTRMETPTEVHLTDIHGTGPDDVWAVGYDVSTAETVLIHYDGIEWNLMYQGDINDWFTYNENKLSGVIKSVHAFSQGIVHVLSNSNGIYTTSIDSVPNATLQIVDLTWQGMINMKGNHSNDLYISGTGSSIAHYNGQSVYRYSLEGEMDLWDLNVSGNRVISIGKDTASDALIAFIGFK